MKTDEFYPSHYILNEGECIAVKRTTLRDNDNEVWLDFLVTEEEYRNGTESVYLRYLYDYDYKREEHCATSTDSFKPVGVLVYVEDISAFTPEEEIAYFEGTEDYES